ncbi:carbonate dehydratase [Cardinium endosymbiont of Culicoides punctatus]|uniref:carbonate dehydratase n=1 Tax=Cardinium endosymbiont of Culicoides punctatus TaxID=2304601 RepID=UPI001058559F|nr:carbonate dehydratase [Cardinium endosymbiont of Culicoides punctatus]TDG95656.1 Carbonic anhydrase 2 [Cardinium endosymbiont of Culicoides punctatus]
MIDQLLKNNKTWSLAIQEEDPDFFNRLATQQAPHYLWIGCSDSRVPANQIVGLLPGDIFVHRNIANLVIHTDLNCLSVIQYAVDILKIQHIMVVGHYGCGGIKAALNGDRVGLTDNWLRHVQDIKQKYATHFEKIETEHKKWDLLCKLNVIEQTINVCQTTIVQEAWAKNQMLTVYGLIYSLKNGILTNLGITIKHMEEVTTVYEQAIKTMLIKRDVL